MRDSVVPIPVETPSPYPKYFTAICPICSHSISFSVWSEEDEKRAKAREGSFIQKYCGYCRDTVNITKIKKMSDRDYYEGKPKW